MTEVRNNEHEFIILTHGNFKCYPNIHSPTTKVNVSLLANALLEISCACN